MYDEWLCMDFSFFQLFFTLLKVRCRGLKESAYITNNKQHISSEPIPEKNEFCSVEEISKTVEKFVEISRSTCSDTEDIKAKAEQITLLAKPIICSINRCLEKHYSCLQNLYNKLRKDAHIYGNYLGPKASSTFQLIFADFLIDLKYNPEFQTANSSSQADKQDKTHITENYWRLFSEFMTHLSKYRTILSKNLKYCVNWSDQDQTTFLKLVECLELFLSALSDFNDGTNIENQVEIDLSSVVGSLFPTKAFLQKESPKATEYNEYSCVLLDYIMSQLMLCCIYGPYNQKMSIEDTYSNKNQVDEWLKKTILQGSEQTTEGNTLDTVSVHQCGSSNPDQAYFSMENRTENYIDVESNENCQMDLGDPHGINDKKPNSPNRTESNDDENYNLSSLNLEEDSDCGTSHIDSIGRYKSTHSSTGDSINQYIDVNFDSEIKMAIRVCIDKIRNIITNLIWLLFGDLQALLEDQNKLGALDQNQIKDFKEKIASMYQSSIQNNPYYKSLSNMHITDISQSSMKIPISNFFKEILSVVRCFVHITENAPYFENAKIFVLENHSSIYYLESSKIHFCFNQERITIQECWLFFTNISQFQALFSDLLMSM